MQSACRILSIGGLTLAGLIVAAAVTSGQDPAHDGVGTGVPVVQLSPSTPASKTPTTIELPSTFLQPPANPVQDDKKNVQNPPQTDQQKKQLELLQKQIEAQQKMIELLADQVKKQATSSAPFEKLQAQSAVLEGRSVRSAQRDQ